MTEIMTILLNNLQNVGIGILLFIAAYVSNMSFSLYYNIKILKEQFDKQKLIDSGIKIVAFGVGTILLCVAVTTIPIFADYIGFTIPDEYSEVFQDLAILGIFIVSACKYILEAYSKFKKILNNDQE